MSFKSTSENLNHIKRVASTSTRLSPTGRIDLIPENAREPEEYYNEIRDQYKLLADQLYDTELKLADINKQLRITITTLRL
jgi:hypothetical protein